MPRCPNCSYILTLLEKRNKYKCAKCGKLFSKKEIDIKEFREWDKQQKKKDGEEFERQLKLRRKRLKSRGLSKEEIQKKLKEYRAKYHQFFPYKNSNNSKSQSRVFKNKSCTNFFSSLFQWDWLPQSVFLFHMKTRLI